MATQPDNKVHVDCSPVARATNHVLSLCDELGFALAGIARPDPSAWAEAFRRWIAEHKHGEMAYMAVHEAVRLDARRMLDGARSVICVADRYHDGGRDCRDVPGRGRIARYARGDDYHRVIKKRLHTLCDALIDRYPEQRFRACVDTAPVLERELAQRAGIGSVGKHTLIIERGVGSYLLLGEVFTTLELTPSEPAQPDPCATCTRCIDACPTDAITPWSVDATRCISYLTIEHRSTTDPSLHEPTGDWLFGCDICQEVCPHGQPTRRQHSAAVHDAYKQRHSGFDLLEVLRWTEQDRRAAFVGSAMKRARLNMMKRNAIIVATNQLMDSEIPELEAEIRRLAVDGAQDALVRQTAQQSVERFSRATKSLD